MEAAVDDASARAGPGEALATPLSSQGPAASADDTHVSVHTNAGPAAPSSGAFARVDDADRVQGGVIAGDVGGGGRRGASGAADGGDDDGDDGFGDMGPPPAIRAVSAPAPARPPRAAALESLTSTPADRALALRAHSDAIPGAAVRSATPPARAPPVITPLHRYDLALNADRLTHVMEGVWLDRMCAAKGAHAHRDNPTAEWPFLLRFKILTYGPVLGTCSQSIVWKALATGSVHEWAAIPIAVAWVWWVLGLALLVAVSVAYAAKAFWWRGAVLREFAHPIRSNFFAAPLLATMFLMMGWPSGAERGSASPGQPQALVSVVMAAWAVYAVLTYRRWIFSTGGGNTMQDSNPAYQVSIVGNILGARLLAQAGLPELAELALTVGMLLWIVMVCTLFQDMTARNAAGELWRLPPGAHPTLFFFVAPPCAASLAAAAIGASAGGGGGTGGLVRVTLWIGMFLYVLALSWVPLMVRAPKTPAMWASTFPQAAAGLALHEFASSLAAGSAAASVAFVVLLVSSLTTAVLFAWTVLLAVDGRLWGVDDVVAVCLEEHPPPSVAAADIDSDASSGGGGGGAGKAAVVVGLQAPLSQM